VGELRKCMKILQIPWFVTVFSHVFLWIFQGAAERPRLGSATWKFRWGPKNRQISAGKNGEQTGKPWGNMGKIMGKMRIMN